MSRIAIIVANGSEDIEVVTPLDIWRRAGILVKLISIDKKKNVNLANGTKISCEEILSKENLSKYNAIYLPGGKGYKLFNEENTPKLVSFCKKNAKNKSILFLALCAAPECFYDWGMLSKDIKVTCYPGQQNGKFEQNYVNESVVVSKNFITGSGPGVASDFAFKVVEVMESSSKSKEIKNQMLYK